MSQTTKVYRVLADTDKYEFFIMRDPEDCQLIQRFNGQPFGDSPPSLCVDIIQQYVQRKSRVKLGQGDFPYLASNIPVFSAKAVSSLNRLLEGNGELIPLLCDALDRYFIFNVTAISDALDLNRSMIRRFSSGRLMTVTSYVLKAEMLPDCHIFKVMGTTDMHVFVTDRFVQQVQDEGLLGFIFNPIQVLSVA